MSPHPEERVVRELSAGLDRLTEAIDASASRQLDAARSRALGRARLAAAPWALAAGSAAALALAVGIVLYQHSREEPPMLAQQPVADAELYEELEFYLWLSEELESQ